MQGLISETSDNEDYIKSVDWFNSWCKINMLPLNTDKTKELIIDFRINKDPIENLVIENKVIEQVDLYVYLGVSVDRQLNWNAQTSSVISKLNKRMYFLRKLGTFQIDRCHVTSCHVTFLLLSYGKCFKILHNLLGREHYYEK